MLLHRLALHKILQLLKLDEFFKEDERQTKSKKVYKKLLLLDQKMDMYVSFLLSLISILTCLIIPVVVLENPCQIFKEKNMDMMYAVASWLETHVALIDRLIVMLSVILVFVSAQMISEGILNTDISMSPWREQGKYNLPGDFRCSIVIRTVLPIKQF